MTINTTRWSPDTCSCSIEYTWDSEATDQDRTHTLSSIEKCPVHSSLTDIEAYTAVTDENPRKNIALQQCLELGPAGLSDTTPEGAKVLKSSLGFNFSWSGTAPNRVLTISFTGINLTTQQKNAIQSVLTNRFGGKVLIA